MREALHLGGPVDRSSLCDVALMQGGAVIASGEWIEGSKYGHIMLEIV